MKNREIVANFYGEDIEQGGRQLRALLAPEAEWREPEGFPYGGVFVGSEAVQSCVMARLVSEWQGYRNVPDTYLEAGDTVVVTGQSEGVYRATWKRFRSPFVHLWTLAEGKVIRFTQHLDTHIVLQAMQ